MSTQPAPAAGAPVVPFKTQEEFEAFLKRVVTEEASSALTRSLQPLLEPQAAVMRDMLAASERGRADSARPKGHLFARLARAKALAFKETGQANDLDAVKAVVSKHWGSDDPVLKGIEGAARLKATAAQAQDPTSLGHLVIPQWSREFIELLRNKPTVRSFARVIPNPTGSLTLRRQTSGGTAYWVGEGKTITPSKPGVGLMNFIRKKLAALSVISNDLVRYAGPEADQFVLDDLLMVSAIAEDLAFIRADGTEYTPKGLRNIIAAAHTYAQTGTALADIDNDFSKAMRLIEEANVVFDTAEIHWLMVPRTWWALWNAKPATDTGFRPYRESLEKGTLLGGRAHKTNQIPKNLGGGSNESETIAVHGPSCWIADTLNVQVDIFPGGAYEDGGAVVSGISRDESVIRVLRETDFNMRYEEAGAVVTGVTLGA